MSSIRSTDKPSRQLLSSEQAQKEKERERDVREQHRSDINELRALHKDEVEKLNANFTERERKIQERHKSVLNERDVQHQKEIDALRAIYEKRIRDSKQDE